MSDIARARMLASEAHAGQTRKFSGGLYVAHPIRVADTVRRGGAPTFVVVAAMLHDVIEDTPVTAERIEAEFGPQVASLVRNLTHRDGETYEDYIARIAGDPWSTVIKRADLVDNLATLPTGHDLAKRYIAALVTLHHGKHETARTCGSCVYYRACCDRHGWCDRPLWDDPPLWTEADSSVNVAEHHSCAEWSAINPFDTPARTETP